MGRVLPPLVLLHGFTQTRQSWRRTAQALAGRYRAIVPDLPGHGQALHRTPSFDACAAYVRALARTRTFTLAGYSMGGRIALHSALTLGTVGRHPARAGRREPGARGPGRARRAPGGRRRAGRAASRRWRSRPSRASGAHSRCSRVSRRGSPAAPTPTGCATRPPGWLRRCEASAPARWSHSGTGCRQLDDPGHARSPASATRSSARSPRAMLERLPNAPLVVIPARATPRSSRTRPRSRPRSTNRARPLRRPPRSRRGRSRLPRGRRTPRRRA